MIENYYGETSKRNLLWYTDVH